MTRRSSANLLAYAAALVAFIFTGLFGLMLFNTFAPLRPPIMPVGVTVDVGYSSTGIATVYEKRDYKGYTDNQIQLQRHVHPMEGASRGFVIEGGYIGAGADDRVLSPDGVFTVISAIRLPIGTQGWWCSGADIVWYPTLSLKAHRLETEDFCFEVKTDAHR